MSSPKANIPTNNPIAAAYKNAAIDNSLADLSPKTMLKSTELIFSNMILVSQRFAFNFDCELSISILSLIVADVNAFNFFGNNIRNNIFFASPPRFIRHSLTIY